MRLACAWKKSGFDCCEAESVEKPWKTWIQSALFRWMCRFQIFPYQVAFAKHLFLKFGIYPRKFPRKGRPLCDAMVADRIDRFSFLRSSQRAQLQWSLWDVWKGWTPSAPAQKWLLGNTLSVGSRGGNFFQGIFGFSVQDSGAIGSWGAAVKRVKKSKNSTDAVALALAGGGFLAHSDLERNVFFFSVFSVFFYGLVCQQVGFLKMEWKEKRRFCLTLVPQSGWLHQHASKVPCLAFLLVWPLSSICRTCYTTQNTSTSQSLTCMASVMICCPHSSHAAHCTSLGGGSPPSPLKLQELLRNVEVIATASAAGWFVGQLAYSVNFLLLDRCAMLEVKSIWEKGEDHLPTPKSLCENFKMIMMIIDYCWCLFGVIQTNVGNIMQHFLLVWKLFAERLNTKTWRRFRCGLQGTWVNYQTFGQFL